MKTSTRLFLALSVLVPCAVVSSACGASEPEPLRAATDGGSEGGDSGSATEFGSELCAEGFCWVRPTPQGNPLRAVAVVGDEAWAVGDGGAVLRRRDGTWKVAPVLTTSSLQAVFGTAPDDVWIVGGGGVVLHFDGARLSVVPSGVETTLRGVWAASRRDVWIVGESGSILHYDGAALTQVATAPDQLHAVWGSGAGDVWAVGGTFNVGTVGHLVGGAWSWASSGLSGAGWNAVAGSSSNDVWITGYDGRVAHYDGTSWTESRGVLGRAEGIAVAAVAPGEAYFATRESFFGLVDGKYERFDGVAPGNAFAISRAGDLTFVADRGAITRGVPPNAQVEVAAPTEQIFAVTPEEHLLAFAGKYPSARVVDLTTNQDVVVFGATDDEPAMSSVLMADDGTLLLSRKPGDTDRSKPGVGVGNAFAFADGKRWVDVPNPASVPFPEGVVTWYVDGDDPVMVAARSKDDVWFLGAPLARNGNRTNVADYRPALLHYIRGAYEIVPLPETCLQKNGPVDAAVRSTADGAVVGCGCSVLRVRGSRADTPVSWSCEEPGVGGHLSRPSNRSIYLDGDTIYLAYVLSEYAYTRDFVYHDATPVVSRVVGGKRERLTLPAGLTSIESLEVILDRGASGGPAAYLTSGAGRSANYLELTSTGVVGKRLPVGTISAVHSTARSVYLSNGAGLLRSR